jgi:hypothetical protein
MDIESELTHAREAPAAGQPGKARVCARRAAGWAIREWYRRLGGAGWRGDALKQLARLRDDERAPEAVRQAAARLTTKVDEHHHVPFDADPLEDAQTLIAFASEDKGFLSSP